MKVLVAENNEQTLNHLCEILEKDGFSTLRANDGQQALDKYADDKPDFICLDIMMDGISGYDVCKEIRKTDEDTPIIFISGKTETFDKILGLELGADDYIVKPFDIHEVVTRIRTVARRCLKQTNPANSQDEFVIGNVHVFPNKLKGEKGEQTIDLSLRDVKILKLLHDNKNTIVDRNVLLDYCWGAHIMPESRTVDWHAQI